MWRPEGWVNKHYHIIEERKERLTEPMNTTFGFVKDLQGWAYESGADAMLEALRSGATYLNNDGTHGYGLVLGRKLERGEKGWLIFIPDK